MPGDGLFRVRLTLAYDGGEFRGWARQADDLRTVQGVVEDCVGHVVGVPVRVQCAGRTDAGVHARGQVAHLDLPLETAVPTAKRLNRALPADVRVRSIDRAPEGFDARFSALWRRYSYRVSDDGLGPDPLERSRVLLWTRPLDLDLMNAAAARLLGEHDFAAFCKPRDYGTTVRRLLGVTWHRDEAHVANMDIRADAFCHSMVRSLVGALLPVGDGRRPVEWPSMILSRGVRDSSVTVMPAHPLILEEVGYPADHLLLDRQRHTRSLRTGEQ